MSPAGRPVETDVSAGAWIITALDGQEPGTVAALLPPVFEAYARVFHPAVRYDGDDDVDVPWADVAAHNGTIAHPAMEWASMTGSWEYLQDDDQPGLWNDSPAQGHLPVSAATVLAAVLARHTTTPTDCWFGVENTWHGDARPALDLNGFSYVLARGPVELAAANFAPEPVEQSANLWWPEDRAWYVATDVDLMTTYVGGSAACIAELLATEGLEAFAVPAGQKVTWDADTINPLPPR